MRKWIALQVLLTLVIVPAAVMAQDRAGKVSGSGVTRLSRQAFHFATGDAGTSSQSFTNIPGLGREVCATGSVMGTVSLNLSGGVVEVRLVDHAPGGNNVLHPSLAHFNPSAGTTSFSFSFVEALGSPHIHTFNPEWRSTTGGPVNLHGGALVLQYDSAPRAC
ncbi:MAG TPA: hypothetical protein VGB19_06060 [Actinomycetota bacterium]